MVDQIETYILANARPLDRALYLLLTGKTDQSTLVSELKNYQNPDGGFGHGIEPDLQAPTSTAIATSVALQYIVKGGITDQTIIEPAINYLLDNYDPKLNGWFRTTKEINNYPHAPWWEYDENNIQKNWPNPTVEITGYFNKFQELVPEKSLLNSLNASAQKYLAETEIDEVHDLLCYQRYFELSPSDFSGRNRERLVGLINTVVEQDQAKWKQYVPKPLDFISSAKSPFLKSFNKQLIAQNLAFLEDSLVGDHWEPTWNWNDSSKDWERAKLEWSGILTVNNFLLLKSFSKS